MRASLAVPFALLLLLPGLAAAGEITDVQDAADGDDPWDFRLDVRYERAQTRAKITKEFHNNSGSDSGDIIDSTELRYVSVQHMLDFTGHFGLYHDLELRVGFPVVISRDITWNRAAATSAANSVLETNEFGNGVCPGAQTVPGDPDVLPTVTHDPGTPNDTADDSDPYPAGWRYDSLSNTCIRNQRAKDAVTGAGREDAPVAYSPLFPTAGEASFAGVGDPKIGLSWGILNDERDDTKPSWVLGFDYKIPVIEPADPTAGNTKDKPGSVGDGFHRFTFWTAMSKRIDRGDPYVKFHYTLSVPSSKAFNNCDAPETLGTPENCGAGEWTEEETGAKPRHVGGVFFGSEVVPWEDKKRQQKFFVDAGLIGEYHSEGRDYSEASWMLKKLTYTEQFGRIGGRLGVGFRGAEYVMLKLETGLTIDTAHMLTTESIGNDATGACSTDPNTGAVTPFGCEEVGLDNFEGELNPNFDFRYDVPGRRLRISEVYNFTFAATGVLTF